MICECCGKEHDGSYGSGRFCSRSCANTRKPTEAHKLKCKETLKKTLDSLEKDGRACKKCGKKYFSRDLSRDLCFDCLPSTIKHTKGKEDPKSILDLSLRTTIKVLRRMKMPCSCCGFYVDGVSLDVHHMKARRDGGSDDMDNLTYICPNCHRIAHTDLSLLPNPLVSLSEQLEKLNLNWKDFYYG